MDNKSGVMKTPDTCGDETPAGRKITGKGISGGPGLQCRTDSLQGERTEGNRGS